MTPKLWCGVAMTLALLASPTPSLAKETNLGKHSQDEIKNACNAAGGELLGISELGSYGCDNGKNGGGMVLCNKNNECTGYTEARTRSDINRIKAKLHLSAKAKARR